MKNKGNFCLMALVGTLVLGCNQPLAENQGPRCVLVQSYPSPTGYHCMDIDSRTGTSIHLYTSMDKNQVRTVQRSIRNETGQYAFNVNVGTDQKTVVFVYFTNQIDAPLPKDRLRSFQFKFARQSDGTLGIYHYDPQNKKSDLFVPATGELLTQTTKILALADQFVAYGKENPSVETPMSVALSLQIDSTLVIDAPAFPAAWKF